VTLPVQLQLQTPGSAARTGPAAGDAAVVEGPATSSPAAGPTPCVVGIDASLTATGLASTAGWCDTVGLKNVTTLPLAARLAVVDQLAEQILTAVGTPDLAVIEVPAFSRSGAGTLERSALWWAVVRSLHRRDIPVAEVFTGTRMRYATGKGSAAKTAIVDAVARRLPMFATGGDDNRCDAVVLCAMGADHLGHPLAVMPATHRAALAAVDWPVVAGWAVAA
jgi:Holliday junction resolvasome RuvABC endonuclease subunit